MFFKIAFVLCHSHNTTHFHFQLVNGPPLEPPRFGLSPWMFTVSGSAPASWYKWLKVVYRCWLLLLLGVYLKVWQKQVEHVDYSETPFGLSEEEKANIELFWTLSLSFLLSRYYWTAITFNFAGRKRCALRSKTHSLICFINTSAHGTELSFVLNCFPHTG